MQLGLNAQILLEAQRQFAATSLMSHSSRSALDEFERELLGQGSAVELERIAATDPGLTKLLIKLGNSTIKNSDVRLQSCTLRSAINRVGLEGCRASLVSYRFEVMIRDMQDDDWSGVFRTALNKSINAASFARSMCARLGEINDIQKCMMVAMLYSSSVFAKIIAAQALGLQKSDTVLAAVKQPSSILCEMLLLSCKVPVHLIHLVHDIERSPHQTKVGQIARAAWQRAIGGSEKLPVMELQ